MNINLTPNELRQIINTLKDMYELDANVLKHLDPIEESNEVQEVNEDLERINALIDKLMSYEK